MRGGPPLELISRREASLGGGVSARSKPAQGFPIPLPVFVSIPPSSSSLFQGPRPTVRFVLLLLPTPIDRLTSRTREVVTCVVVEAGYRGGSSSGGQDFSSRMEGVGREKTSRENEEDTVRESGCVGGGGGPLMFTGDSATFASGGDADPSLARLRWEDGGKIRWGFRLLSNRRREGDRR